MEGINMVKNLSEEEKQKLQVMEQEIKITKNMSRIKHKIAVMSGKGGVGKSTVSANLASAFAGSGFKTGVLDSDLHGPNIPQMFGMEISQLQCTQEGIKPLETDDGIKVMSTEILLPSNEPLIWRGPKKTGAIRQFLSDVLWGDLDVLVIDCPPGTGDEPLTVLQSIPQLDGVVVVTTPHPVALDDVERSIKMVQALKIPVLGVVENMSTFKCPHCGEEIPIFGKNGGKQLAEDLDIPLLGTLPLYQNEDEGGIKNPEFLENFSKIVDKIVEVLDK